MTKRLLRNVFAGLLIAASSTNFVLAGAVPFAAHQSPKDEITTMYRRWLAALSTGTPDAVEKLYSTHAVLLPTFSDKIADTPKLRHDYFKKLTAKDHLKGTAKISIIRVFNDIAINSGYYDFSYNEGTAFKEIHARFSFVYHKTRDGWLIVDHHSSEMPKPEGHT
jgi:uncharacterized protein (TIGR02246 family)